MDIYTVNASDLLEYIGEDKQQQLSDSFNPAKKSTPHNCLTIGITHDNNFNFK